MTAFYSLTPWWQFAVLGLIFTACALLGAVLTIMWQTHRQCEEDVTARAETARLRDRIEADIHRAIRQGRPIRRQDIDPETDWLSHDAATPARRARLLKMQKGH